MKKVYLTQFGSKAAADDGGNLKRCTKGAASFEVVIMF